MKAAFPDGHFYSPVVDVDNVRDEASAVWPKEPKVLGIDFNDTSHRMVLTEWFAEFYGAFDYPDGRGAVSSPNAYFTGNGQFEWLDARTLFVVLQAHPPRQIIEVGSGYSSLLTADVNARFLGNSVDFICVDPEPRTDLEQAPPGLTSLIRLPVQHLPLSMFEALEEGDILFIDSSHVTKTGSDVNFLYFEVLPRLQPGVRVHIHDVFLPHEYPARWVLEENRSWNEQYLVRALLMYSSAFRVFFGCQYAFSTFPDLLAAAINVERSAVYGGGSFWIERI